MKVVLPAEQTVNIDIDASEQDSMLVIPKEQSVLCSINAIQAIENAFMAEQEVDVFTRYSVCATITNIDVTAGQTTATFDITSEFPAYHRIRYRKTGTSTWTTTTWTSSLSATSQIQVSGLDSSQEYDYQGQGCVIQDDDCECSWTTLDTFTTESAGFITDFNIINITETSFQVTYKTQQACTCKGWIRDHGNGDFSLAFNILFPHGAPPATHTHNITGLITGKQYDFYLAVKVGLDTYKSPPNAPTDYYIVRTADGGPGEWEPYYE